MPHATTAGEWLPLESLPDSSIRLQAALQAAPTPRPYGSRDMQCGESTCWQKSLMTFVVIFMPATALCGTCMSPVGTAGMLHFLWHTKVPTGYTCCFQDGGHCITGYEVLGLHSVLSYLSLSDPCLAGSLIRSHQRTLHCMTRVQLFIADQHQRNQVRLRPHGNTMRWRVCANARLQQHRARTTRRPDHVRTLQPPAVYVFDQHTTVRCQLSQL